MAGKKGRSGRLKRLTPGQEAEAVAFYDANDLTQLEVARRFGVSLRTFTEARRNVLATGADLRDKKEPPR